MPKVLISDDLSPRAAEILAARGIEVDMLPGIGGEELKARIAGYDGLAVRSATKVTAELLACAPKLKIVGRAGIGVDNIDVAVATGRGIVVMNTPYGNSTTAAEHAIEAFIPYVEARLKEGVPLSAMTRHLLGLFNGRPGARAWRRQLSTEAVKQGADARVRAALGRGFRRSCNPRLPRRLRQARSR